ncbi:PREDICTED: matrix extracellular phosphoglycoprotein [Miniopterus natalensis]|uniref:matrix extracellular phosphoglycoprotein n=1 Tax=Miniopterus natalensis TaxID=291302 RepID=UPI0007A70558|nr:PREDICTED: matrix extracellular phosphoglycoprotein [Miniopterus natalensis]
MQIVCLGLLLFHLTWAASMVQPQTEGTKQDCVEEQGITYKGHHEKHGHYIFQYVYTPPGRKNRTNIKEDITKDNTALHHSGKRRHQGPAPQENRVQGREKDLLLLGVDKKKHISNRENAHNDLTMPICPDSTGNNRPGDGADVLSRLRGQEEHGTALTRNDMRRVMEPGAVTELLGAENKELKARNGLNKILSSANHAKSSSKGKKNHQRDPQALNIPIKSKSTHQIHHDTDSLKQFPKLKKIPSDFEGSGYLDLQGRGDNDISPFSGDGQPFKDISGKGDAVDPDLEGADTQTEVSGLVEAETVNPEAGGPGNNDIPGTAENGKNTIGTRDGTAQEANADVSLLEGGNHIAGSTKFKELPGKEGSRADAGSQNAHQGKVEFHYPHVSSKEQRKEGSRDVAESTNYNEIPKNGKGSSRKGTEHSTRNQVTSSEKQRFPSEGKRPGQLIPSRGLDNEIINERGSHSGPSNEGTVTTHSGKNHYVPHRQNSATWSKGVPQGKGSRAHRKSHANRRVRLLRKHASSESSDSGSSSESDGD